jgi:2,3-bisphosphoglycerate-dependent phosphoglycerate mutase
VQRLLLIRHCQAAWSEDNVWRPLSEVGVEQAERLRDWLLKSWAVDAIISSPYRRTLDTIAPFAAASGLVVTLDERLREREAPFLSAAADHIAAAEACFADHLLRFEGSETGREAQERGWQAIDAALNSHEQPVLVTHGQLLSFTLARIDGTTGAERWRTMTTPDVFFLESSAPGVFRVEQIWQTETS